MIKVQGCGYAGSCGAAELGRYRGDGDVREVRHPKFPAREGGVQSLEKLIDPPPTAPAIPVKEGHFDAVA